MPNPPTRAGLRHRATALVATGLFVVVGVVAAPVAADEAAGETLEVSPAQSAPAATWRPDGVIDERADGLVHAGLDDAAVCAGGYQVEGTPGLGRRAFCTHGPDPATVDVDVRIRPSLGELMAREDETAADAGTTAGCRSGAGALLRRRDVREAAARGVRGGG